MRNPTIEAPRGSVRGTRIVLSLAAFAAVGLLAPEVALAQYTVPWKTIECGGSGMTAPTWFLRSSQGQVDAGDQSAGGTFDFLGGFWPVVRHLRSSMIFGDGFETGNTVAWSATQPLAPEQRAANGGSPAESGTAPGGEVPGDRTVR